MKELQRVPLLDIINELERRYAEGAKESDSDFCVDVADKFGHSAGQYVYAVELCNFRKKTFFNALNEIRWRLS